MDTVQHPSRFLSEIPKDLVERINTKSFLA